MKTAYYMLISDWSSDVCSSDLRLEVAFVVDQEVCRDHHAVALVHTLTDLDHPLSAPPDRHFTGLETSLAPVEDHDLPRARVDHGAVGNRDHGFLAAARDPDLGIHVRQQGAVGVRDLDTPPRRPGPHPDPIGRASGRGRGGKDV